MESIPNIYTMVPYLDRVHELAVKRCRRGCVYCSNIKYVDRKHVIPGSLTDMKCSCEFKYQMVTESRCLVWIHQDRNPGIVCWARNKFGAFHQLTYHYRISIAGLVVLGGHTKVEDPMINWHDAWKGTSSASAYGATNAMIKLIFSYSGYTNAFSVVNEIKVCYWLHSASG